MWRVATASDDEAVVSMCMALNAEDPRPTPVRPQQVVHACKTARRLQSRPSRGLRCRGSYGRLRPADSVLVERVSEEKSATSTSCLLLPVSWAWPGDSPLWKPYCPSLWPIKPTALALEVSLQNERARALYERLGFRGKNLAMRGRCRHNEP